MTHWRTPFRMLRPRGFEAKLLLHRLAGRVAVTSGRSAVQDMLNPRTHLLPHRASSRGWSPVGCKTRQRKETQWRGSCW